MAEFCSKYGFALDSLSPPGLNTGAAREMDASKGSTQLFLPGQSSTNI